MPTTIYTKQSIKQVSHKGKHYQVIDGAVDVPDEAVDDLCEAHGFTIQEPQPNLKQGIEMPVDKPVNRGGRPKRVKSEEGDDEQH